MNHSRSRFSSAVLTAASVATLVILFYVVSLPSRDVLLTQLVPGLGAPGTRSELQSTTRDAVVSATRASIAGSHVGGAVVSDGASLRVTGRVVDLQGAPIAGAALELRARPIEARNTRTEIVSGVRSDVDGRFAIESALSADRALTFVASATGSVDATWNWFVDTAERHEDLGDVVLLSSARVTCVVLARGGGLVSGRGWAVGAGQESLSASNGRAGYAERRGADVASGLFVFPAVPSGPLDLHLYGGDGLVAGRAGVVVEPGGDHYVEIESAVADLADCIHVQVKSAVFGAVQPHAITSVHAEDATGRRLAARPPREATPWYTIPGCGPGEYTVHVRADDFAPFTAASARAGDFVAARLVGNASARFVVTDAGGPRPPIAMDLDVSMRTPNSSPTRCTVRGRPDGDAVVFEGLLAGRQEWIARVPGSAPSLLPDMELAPLETRTVQLDLAARTSVTGVVLERASRRPLGGVRVELIPEPPSGVRPASVWQGEPLITGITDAETGRFALASLAPASYRVRAVLGPLLHSEEARVVLDQDVASHEVIELELDAAGGIAGRIRAPQGASSHGLSVIVAPLRHESTRDGRVTDLALRRRVAIEVSADGTFRSGPLPPGPARVVLSMPDLVLPSGSGGTLTTSGGSIDLATVEVIPGEWAAHEFDATSSFPGTVTVNASLDGRAAWGCVLELQLDRGTHLLPKAGAVVPPGGRATLGPLVPGEYVLTLRPVERSWVWTAADRVRVLSASDVRSEARVTVEHGHLALVDRDGRPTPNERVRIRAVATPPPNGAEFAADDTGMVELALPPGRYSIARGDASGILTRVEFAWPLGPEHARGLRLPD